MKIFITYAHEDFRIANKLRLELIQDNNHEVFLDASSLDKGAPYGSVIRKNLKKTDLLIFLISPYSVEKGSYTLSELRIFENHYPKPWGRVLPVLIAATQRQLIPDYLCAATLVLPEGDLVADVAAEVDKITLKNEQKNEENILKGKLSGFTITSVILIALAIPIFIFLYVNKNKSVYASDGEKTAFNENIVIIDKFESKNDAQIRCDRLKTYFKEAGQYRSNEDIFVVRSHNKKGEWLLIIDVGRGPSSPAEIIPYMNRIIDSISRQGFYIQNRLGRELKNRRVEFYDSLKFIKLYGKIANPGKM